MMEILKPGVDIDAFFDGVKNAKKRALFLDYDGTLSPFQQDRDTARPYPGVREALDSIQEGCDCRLVIISGRYTKDVIHLIGLKELPEIWGTHGWERLMPDGGYGLAELGAAAREGLSQAALWAEKSGLSARVEQKPASLAVHWRGLSDEEAAGIRERSARDLGTIADYCGLELHDFDGGIELRAPGRDKGHAVETVLGELGEGASAAYLGDDLTDEDGFSAIEGRGLGVLVREEPRQTAAGLWLKPPKELLWFLRRYNDACGGD